MRQRKLVVGLLILLALMTSTFTYAYWAGNIAEDYTGNTGTVSIGTGGDSTITLTFTGASVSDLVPDSVDSSKSTSVLSFTVVWTEDVDDTVSGLSGTVNADIDSFIAGDLTEAATAVLFNVTVTAGNGEAISLGDTVTIEVTVFFENAPANEDEYDDVAGKDLTVTLTVSVDLD